MKKLILILLTTTITSFADVEFSGYQFTNEEVEEAEAAAEKPLTRYQKVTEALIRTLHMTGQEAEDFRLLREEAGE